MLQKKTKQINVAVTPETKERGRYGAEKKNMTIPQFVRHCVTVCIMAYEKTS